MLKKLTILLSAMVVVFPGCRWFTSVVSRESRCETVSVVKEGSEVASAVYSGFIKCKQKTPLAFKPGDECFPF